MKQPHLRQLDLNLLAALEALMAEHNVTRAAERLGVTQSAMSHMLARLRSIPLADTLLHSPSGRQGSVTATLTLCGDRMYFTESAIPAVDWRKAECRFYD